VHVAKNKTQQRIKLAKKRFMGSQEVSTQRNHIANICVPLCAVKSKKKCGQNGLSRGDKRSTFVHIFFHPHFFLSTLRFVHISFCQNKISFVSFVVHFFC